jgi:RNA 2',3'-cyclic 3'-phosphodiesterase
MFLAVVPDDPASSALGRLAGDVEGTLGEAAHWLRWTPRLNIHVTLYFLGDVDDEPARRLTHALAAQLQPRPFEISLGPPQFGPSAGPPRVLWLPIDRGSDRLQQLHRELGERIGGAGLALEPRAFTPHLTVARVRDRHRREAGRLRGRIDGLPRADVRWIVAEVVLFLSDLGGPSPRYEAIHRTALAGG